MSDSQAFQNVIRALWEFILMILQGFGQLWVLIMQPITFGGINIFGIQIIKGFTFNMLFPTVGVLGAIIVIGVVSLFNPFE